MWPQTLTIQRKSNFERKIEIQTCVKVDFDSYIQNFFYYYTKPILTLIPKHQLNLVSCSTIMQIHKKNPMSGSNCFEERNAANHYQIVPRQPFFRNCLTISTFGNSTSSSILGDGICISTKLKNNNFSLVWNTPRLVWYDGVSAIVGTISLSR
jgi:hypothetical protein